MSPALKATLTLVGVLLAGLPLLWLTATPRVQTEEVTENTTTAKNRSIHASIYFSGKPQKITLWHNAEEIATFSAPAEQQHFTLNLPFIDSAEIEYEVVWDDSTPGMKGFTLHLEPDGLESKSETMWSLPEDSGQHNVFYFQW